MLHGNPTAREEPAAATRIALCGRVRVTIDDRDLALPTGQTALVLSFLMVRSDLSATREELIDALWPERPPRDPPTALRPVLSRFRRALAPAILDGRERLRLAFPKPVHIDVDEAAQAVEAARVAAAGADWAQARSCLVPALEILREEFMPGVEGDWLERRRREVEELALEALEWAARSALALGEFAAAERHGRELIARSPYRESGHRFLIESLAAGGNVAEALRAYEEVRVLLRDEVGVPPAPELQALHQRLLTGDTVAGSHLPGPWRATGAGEATVELLERDAERKELALALEQSGAAGRVVVVLGEAGIGKTALVTIATVALTGRPVLWGACDPLVTPRPLGAWWDIAHQAGGDLLAALSGPLGREHVLRAALAELDAGAVMVIDDLHWADDQTLDLVALLGRRLRRARGCLVVTCRSEALADRPEVRRVLAGLPREVARRLEPRPLSAVAVEALAGRDGRDAEQLHAATGGNPFFVTEALATPGERVPASVRDAVALRVADLDEAAREVVELAAVNPGPAELELVSATAGGGAEAVDACIAAGLLQLHGPVVAFRHDLARRAVADLIPPARTRHLDTRMLAALEAVGHPDPARLAHHARRSGDVAAIRRLAPAAARAAAGAGAHRQAAEQWEAVLAVSGDAPELRAAALEGVAVEAYLSGRADRALESRRELLALHEAAGDRLRSGDDLRWLSRLLWWTGDGSAAAAVGDRAIAVLEAFPDSAELAQALSGRSQLAMLTEASEEAIALGDRAAELGRRAGDPETVAHALTNVGTALLGGPEHERGRALLEEAHAMALRAGHDEHAARALNNLAASWDIRRRDDPHAAADVARALEFALECELDPYAQYLLGMRATLHLLRGRWAEAEEDARRALELSEQYVVTVSPALVTLGRLQARRGDPGATATLDQAWRLAEPTAELQRLGPAAAARAELAWLAGDLDGAAAAAAPTYELACRHERPWPRAELAAWLRRAGRRVQIQADDPPPYALAAAGRWRASAASWDAIGFPYERAEALAQADESDARREALAVFEALGAARAVERVREDA